MDTDEIKKYFVIFSEEKQYPNDASYIYEEDATTEEEAQFFATEKFERETGLYIDDLKVEVFEQ